MPTIKQLVTENNATPKQRKDAFQLFNYLHNIGPVTINANAVSTAQGLSLASVMNNLRGIRNRNPGLDVRATVKGAKNEALGVMPAAASMPATPVSVVGVAPAVAKTVRKKESGAKTNRRTTRSQSRALKNEDASDEENEGAEEEPDAITREFVDGESTKESEPVAEKPERSTPEAAEKESEHEGAAEPDHAEEDTKEDTETPALQHPGSAEEQNGVSKEGTNAKKNTFMDRILSASAESIVGSKRKHSPTPLDVAKASTEGLPVETSMTESISTTTETDTTVPNDTAEVISPVQAPPTKKQKLDTDTEASSVVASEVPAGSDTVEDMVADAVIDNTTATSNETPITEMDFEFLKGVTEAAEEHSPADEMEVEHVQLHPDVPPNVSTDGHISGDKDTNAGAQNGSDEAIQGSPEKGKEFTSKLTWLGYNKDAVPITNPALGRVLTDEEAEARKEHDEMI